MRLEAAKLVRENVPIFSFFHRENHPIFSFPLKVKKREFSRYFPSEGKKGSFPDIFPREEKLLLFHNRKGACCRPFSIQQNNTRCETARRGGTYAENEL